MGAFSARTMAIGAAMVLLGVVVWSVVLPSIEVVSIVHAPATSSCPSRANDCRVESDSKANGARASVGILFIGDALDSTGTGFSAQSYLRSLIKLAKRLGWPLQVEFWGDSKPAKEHEFLGFSKPLQTDATIVVYHYKMGSIVQDRVSEKRGWHQKNRFYVIGISYGEFEDRLQLEKEAAPFYDEQWAPSTFLASATAYACPTCNHVVVTIPPPIQPVPLVVLSDTERAEVRQQMGIPASCKFIFSFACFSGAGTTRKHPQAFVEAFAQAFKPTDSACAHVRMIKLNEVTESAMRFIDRDYEVQFIRQVAKKYPNVILSEDDKPRELVNKAMSLIDVYVYPERSTGLGLTIIDAMQQEKAVIATRFSGNRDFVLPTTAKLVKFTLGPVGQYATWYQGAEDRIWASIDVPELAEAMKELHEDASQRTRFGKAGKEHVLKWFSSERIEPLMEARLFAAASVLQGKQARNSK